MLRSIAVALLVVSTVIGISNPAAARVDMTTRVTRVYSNTTQILIRFEQSVNGAEGCPGSSENFAIIDNVARQKEMLQIALSAYLSGKQVSVRLSGCNQYPMIHFISLV
jgi:hypothetical protein